MASWPLTSLLLISAFRCACQKSLDAPLKVHVATWNAGGTNRPESLELLLGVDGDDLPDVVIVGLQEATEMFKLAYEWNGHMNLILSEKGYFQVGKSEMMGIKMYVFAQTRHQDQVGAVRTTYRATGALGLGNKGGVILHAEVYGAALCVVNSHLAPHDEGFADRLFHFRNINNIRKSHCNDQTDLFTFWLGDLNFRLKDKALDAKKIVSLIEANELDELLKSDELTIVRENGAAFEDFSEPQITFNPTFKFNATTDVYNLKRRPAWTDRILYKAKESGSIKVEHYTSLPSYRSSDHKPVIARYSIHLN